MTRPKTRVTLNSRELRSMSSCKRTPNTTCDATEISFQLFSHLRKFGSLAIFGYLITFPEAPELLTRFLKPSPSVNFRQFSPVRLEHVTDCYIQPTPHSHSCLNPTLASRDNVNKAYQFAFGYGLHPIPQIGPRNYC